MHRIRSWARTKAHGPSPLSESKRSVNVVDNAKPVIAGTGGPPSSIQHDESTLSRVNDVTTNDEGITPGTDNTVNQNEKTKNSADKDGSKKNVVARFFLTTKDILLSSWINVLLVFVPIGIVAKAAHLSASIIFSMNAIAIIPLAGLLSHATESVAKRMGNTIGALMNVSFGNAVELIIFIALTKNEIRIVQASLLGSILANLLLILGMAFFLGGLRFREQVYNSTVTQMSACLLSLSVMSLLLPTAFHASFQNNDEADSAVLKVSRGTSVILLLVYGLYLLFQLRSHAYMYESTPQHIIDEASVPGPGAAWMVSSSSDSSSSSSDSDDSASKRRRIKKMLRHKRRRSSGSSDKNELSTIHSTSATAVDDIEARNESGGVQSQLPTNYDDGFKAEAGDKIMADVPETVKDTNKGKRSKRHNKHHDKKQISSDVEASKDIPVMDGGSIRAGKQASSAKDQQVSFAATGDVEAQLAQPVRQPFNLRALSVRPSLPKMLSQNVFTQPPQRHVTDPESQRAPPGYGNRKTRSLPIDFEGTPHGSAPVHPSRPFISFAAPSVEDDKEEEENISRTTAVILLLVSTGLVALCADFMVEAIDAVTTGTGVSATFVGLIILPIVGNAAEHVTAVTVAIKNKMDLSIGVAVGSSIQIALFVTPFVVLLGWCMNKEMTLYFTLFETVSLFVSVFVVNFLVLDGRSNYLEGALLMAAYIIIAVAAFFYPEEKFQSAIGGNPEAEANVVRSLVQLAVNVTGSAVQ